MVDVIEIRREGTFNILLNPEFSTKYNEQNTIYQRAIYLLKGISLQQRVYTRRLSISEEDNISVEHEV